MKIKVNGVFYSCSPSELNSILNDEVVVFTSPSDYNPGNYFWLAPDPSDDGLA